MAYSDSDEAVIEFCHGNPLEWTVFAYVGPHRTDHTTYFEELIGITGVRVRYLHRPKEEE